MSTTKWSAGPLSNPRGMLPARWPISVIIPAYNNEASLGPLVDRLLPVLHDLADEEALQLFGLAHAALRPSGRLITYDNCYAPDQSWLARWIVSRDRGQNVRWEPEYRALAKRVFARVRTVVSHKVLRIPYTSIFMECEK